MNKKFWVAAVVALITLPAFAQTERHYEYDEYGKVGRSEGWARRFAHNFYDGLIGAEYYEEHKESITSDKYGKTGKKSKETNTTYRYYGPGHTPGFYFGVNMLCTDRPLTIPDALPQKPGKGFEFGLAIGQWGYHMTKNVGINTALYITRSRYWFDNGYYLNYVPNGSSKSLELVNDDFEGRDVQQGYLRYWSLRVPLCLEISSASRKGPFIAVGPEIEYRFGDVSRIDLYGNSKEKIKGVNVNPIGINGVARIGISDFGIIARYSFTILFQHDAPAETYPFMIGISTSF